MCDCKDAKDNNLDESKAPDMVTIFRPCPQPYHSGKDMVQEIIRGVAPDPNECKPIEFLRPTSDESSASTIVCCAQKSICSDTDSTACTECSRMYKFVNPGEYLREPEYEGEEDFSIISTPCSKDSLEPRRSIKKKKKTKLDLECTLAIIKPEALIYRREIENRIFEEGFEIYQTRWLKLTPEQASEFYIQVYGQIHFPHLVTYMSSSPIIVHVLAKQNAVADWRLIVGPPKVVEARLYFPDSIRGTFGRRGDDFKNAVHGSSNQEEAEREIHFFFPNIILEPIIKDEIVSDYMEELINPTLVKALALCCKLKPPDPVTWLANCLLANNPNKPKYPENLAIIPT